MSTKKGGSAAPTQPILTAKDAHKAGKVWITFKINGGDVAYKNSPVGVLEGKGAYTSEQACAIYRLLNGDTLEQAAEFLKQP